MKSIRPALCIGALAVALLGCGGEKDPVVLEESDSVVFVDQAAEFSPMVWDDGRRTLNDRCMVRQAQLNLRMPPIYVNGEPVGFC